MGVQWGRMLGELGQLERAAADGFQFVQPTRDLVGGLGEERFRRLKAEVAERGLPFLVCAVPLPEEVRVTQRGFNLYAWTEHLAGVVERLAQLGCRALAWSNGRARLLPVEGQQADLQEQALQFLFLLCEVSARFGLTVLIEPLGPRRTNFLNSLAELAGFLPRVRKENLSVLLSLRELQPIGLSTGELPGYRALLAHVQLDNPLAREDRRLSPRPGDGWDYAPFLRALKAAEYAGGISLPEDADAAALAFCRGLWEQAGA